ncbi:unnamed protein product [Rhizoctonia solani]|uniref:Zn(2)-C6 fungal-type domain-containing protein n=1 Tax=Rhizoctonia solani TaxID=456999 RepID=A0A8H2XHY8_9AGAM|nr:unnamed protein product [Rhizoctonia solani]CAE6472135.1 unnamed protein product [Rhizoctonia solani]
MGGRALSLLIPRIHHSMAAPTPTPTHSAPPSTSPAPATTSAMTMTPSEMFPPTAAYATFMHNVLNDMLHELKAVRKELTDIRRNQPSQVPPSANRKRKRPGPTAPCALCRLSRTPCIAAHASEACARCIRKQVHCFDDSENPDQPRVRHPPEDDGPEDAESEPDMEPATAAASAPVWQQPAPNGMAGYPPAPNYPPTPVKRERVTKACADCHARKRKCTGGPNCGARPASSARQSPHKSATTPTARTREPCAECRGRKRRCIHLADGTPNGVNNKSPAEERDELEGMDDIPPTDTEPEPERERPVVDPSPSNSHSRSPPPGRWHYPPGPPPPPHWAYPEQPRGAPPYHAHPHHGAPFMHDRPPYGHPHPHPHPHHAHPGHAPPPHPHGLHPHPHPHARLPPAPDMRHPTVPVSAPDPNLPPSTVTKSTTPTAPVAAPAPPAGRKGRACLACRKLKMRCVAPNEEGGPDERCQRCERAGLDCVYVDRKRRGPGGVFTGQDPNGSYKDDSTSGFAQPENQTPVYDDGRSAKKLKREGSPSSYANGNPPNSNGARRDEDVRTQQDAARALEESFADEEGSER